MDYKYQSFLAPIMMQYKDFCIASGCWSTSKHASFVSFDRYCVKHAGSQKCLSQEVADGWCEKKPTEIANSCRSRIYPVIGLLQYMIERGLTEINIPRIPDGMPCNHVPHLYTEKELTAFFTECDKRLFSDCRLTENKIIAWRLTFPVIMRFLYSTGCRPYEARMLRRNNIDMLSGVVSITKSKANIQHYVVLHSSMLSIIKEYDRIIDSLYPDRRYFFLSTNGEQPIHKEWLGCNYKKIWAKISDVPSSPYDLRHNYAIANINSWHGTVFDQFNKLVFLSKSMGHICLNSTRYYYHFSTSLAKLIEERSEIGFNLLLPEVNYAHYNY